MFLHRHVGVELAYCHYTIHSFPIHTVPLTCREKDAADISINGIITTMPILSFAVVVST